MSTTISTMASTASTSASPDNHPTPAATDARAPYAWIALGLLSMVFHLGLIFSGLVPALVARPLHMALALPWLFLFPAHTRSQRISGTVLMVIGLACCAYMVINADALGNQYGFLENPLQMAIGLALLAVTLEMARRAIGWPLPMVALICLLYAFFGEHIPGQFGHPTVPFASTLGTLTITEGGVWGSLTGVSVNVVAIFVIMGAVLNVGEAGQGFLNIAIAAAGRLRGGAGKVAVLASALFGSISGSASANAASIGAVTMPTMVRLGYPKALAGAVEAVASSGGQIMPPLMGAGAFVMVELTGTPYTQIMGAALLPAILYFLAVWIGIDLFARRYGLRALDQEDHPRGRDVLLTMMFFLVPFGVLMQQMFIARVTPQYAACVAILVGAALLFTNIRFEFSLHLFAQRLSQAAIIAGKQISMIAAIIICASIIIGVLGMTGLGIKVTSVILAVAQSSLWPALLLTALACLLLGMEVPTTAAYVICVAVAGPALSSLGIDLLLAHLFVFWFALLSTITPPVCGTVFITAGIVGENWLKVAASAMRLGIGLYIIPLAMIANPQVIQLASHPIPALFAFVRIGVGLWGLSYAFISGRSVGMRLLAGAMGLVMCFGWMWVR
ncbi:MAG: TRAP transporter fused permease subunit [Castellaniella sp.]